MGRLNVQSELETNENKELSPFISTVPQSGMPEILQNDVYYIANDNFVKKQAAVEEEIVELSKSLEPREAKAAQWIGHGDSDREIIKKMGSTGRTLAKFKKNPKIMQLAQHFRHYYMLLQGNEEIHRREMLWRMAVDNEQLAPKTALGAIAELNKMSGTGQNNSTPNGQPINIVINNASMPKGALDV